jgi:hypothetical protein
VFKTTSYTFTQDDFNRCTIENSVFASKNTYALWLLGDMSNCILRNNTFYTGDDQAMRVEGDIRGGGNQLYNNVFYADSLVSCPYGSVLRHAWVTGFTQNNNLFFARTAAPGLNRSNMAVSYSSCSGVGPGSAWTVATGNDANSRWGSPRFVDSTFANLDVHLLAGSNAIGRGQGGSDAGAFPFVDPGPDRVPPAAVLDLGVSQVGDHFVTIGWTAPGDDGDIGSATAYDLRWSDVEITEANFSSATPVTTQPIPQLAGATQTFVLIGLDEAKKYYFTIRARDEMGNWSPLGGVASVTTHSADQIPPAAVRDLSSSP